MSNAVLNLPIERPRGFRIEARDVSGQKVARASDVPPDATIGEVIEQLTAGMQLPRNGADGAPITYQALLEREGRHLQVTERAGTALVADDRVVLQPNIDAGASDR